MTGTQSISEVWDETVGAVELETTVSVIAIKLCANAGDPRCFYRSTAMFIELARVNRIL